MQSIARMAAGNGRGLPRLRLAVAAGCAIGATMALAATQMEDSDPSDHRALVMLALAELVLGSVLWSRLRFSDRLTKFLCFGVPIAIVTVLVVIAKPLGVSPIYYVWPALTTAYFGTRRDIWSTCGLTGVGFAAALAVSGAEMPATVYASTMAVVGSVAVITSLLNRRVGELVDQHAVAAAVDGLTGALNRRAFAPAFEREFERAVTARLPLSVVAFDLDHFKSINDSHGHAAGDAVLQRFAELLKREQHTGDLVARTGGEEFVAVLFGREESQARAFAERVADRLRAAQGLAPERVTVSAGVAQLAGHASAEDLLGSADRALYAAKAAGRDRAMTAGQVLARAAA